MHLDYTDWLQMLAMVGTGTDVRQGEKHLAEVQKKYETTLSRLQVSRL